MKKVFLILFFLSGCMNAPEKSFRLDPDTEVYPLSVKSIEVVPMTNHFDTLPHIENQMPTSPEEAIQKWLQQHLQSTSTNPQQLWVIIKQADMLKTDLPAQSFFKWDEENYTLNYRLEIQLRLQEETIQSFPVEGKGFITVKKKASLAAKEKGWAWLIQKMLTHLKQKMQTELEDVFVK